MLGPLCEEILLPKKTSLFMRSSFQDFFIIVIMIEAPTPVPFSPLPKLQVVPSSTDQLDFPAPLVEVVDKNVHYLHENHSEVEEKKGCCLKISTGLGGAKELWKG